MPLGDKIVISGAREHNLKNLSVDIPRDKLIVITGVSGSGKSSLAFDTIYAEGQRRYVESLSAYARQFLEQMKKPDVDFIDGLSPSISIDQYSMSTNPRSTVGTITEIYDYFRLLFAKVGHPFCYQCGKEIASQTPRKIFDKILKQFGNKKLLILAPIVRGRKGIYQKELLQYRNRGFARIYIDGKAHDLSEDISLERHKKHDLDLEIDRIVVTPTIEERLYESIILALREGGGLIKILIPDGGRVFTFSEKAACSHCGISYPEIEPRFFSFNSPYGACPSCSGLGFENYFEEDLEDNLEEHMICSSCNGTRLKNESSYIKIQNYNLPELCSLPIASLGKIISSWSFDPFEENIAKSVLNEISQRITFLNNVGLSYLSLNRRANTLSGGEGQRIKLASQIGSSLTGVLYVLDEPSIGLHQRDIANLLNSLVELKQRGNTVIIVEHDEETIRSADFMIDIGPGAGRKGGELLAAGTPKEVIENRNSITGEYLSGIKKIHFQQNKKLQSDSFIKIKNARLHNLKGVDISFPLGLLICVTGVSGSGKSSLVLDTLYENVKKILNNTKPDLNFVDSIDGLNKIESIIKVDHSPIGRTPRSNPATYSQLFYDLRNIFAQVPEAKLRGYRLSRFSFNVPGGRCEACKGDGSIKIEMNLLPSVYVRCESCDGERYTKETLDILFKNKNISEVLNLTVDEAQDLFKNVPSAKRKLNLLKDVGLGYIHLGQSATTLSGGEAQRLKLARELGKRSSGKSLYILDEPTTGLHFADIEMLLKILFRLRNNGNTIIIVEHNLDIIRSADYIIDLGPDGGDNGGYIIATGTPEEISKNKKSVTGKYLLR